MLQSMGSQRIRHDLTTELNWTELTVARQAPFSMEFSRQEYRSGLSFPSPGNLPEPTQVSCITGVFFTVWATKCAKPITKPVTRLKQHKLSSKPREWRIRDLVCQLTPHEGATKARFLNVVLMRGRHMYWFFGKRRGSPCTLGCYLFFCLWSGVCYLVCQQHANILHCIISLGLSGSQYGDLSYSWIFSSVLSRECRFLGSLSHHNKDLEQQTLKPSACHSSQVLDKPCYSS